MEESLKFEIRKGKVRNSVKKRNTITDTKDFLVFYIEMPLHVRNILINKTLQRSSFCGSLLSNLL